MLRASSRFVPLAAILSVATLPACTCSKVDPEPTPATSPNASVASAAADGGVALPPVVAHSGSLEKDPDSGHYKPTTPAPKEDPATLPPTPTRTPDFDLDLDDPSRDYVT